MSMDTFLTIICLIGTAISYAGYRYFGDNVKLTYKEQRVGK
jgi:hypothetical protein